MLYAGLAVARDCGMLYVGIITVVALVAMFAPSAGRRREAREVLKILLYRPLRRR
jgi:hypothetical protein